MTARRELEIKLALPPTSVGRLKKIPLIQALKASPSVQPKSPSISIRTSTSSARMD